MKLLEPILRRFGFTRKVTTERRSFSGAQQTRLTGDWTNTQLSIDTLLRTDLESLRARCDQLSRDNPYIKKFENMLISNVLGHEGITLKNKASDPIGFKDGKIIPGKPDVLANKLIEDAWWDWGRKCTAAQDMSWLEAQQISLKTISRKGGTLWRFVIGPDAGNKYNFAIQPIAITRIDLNKNENLSGGGTIRMGVQRDAMGRKTHYWLYDSDPTDTLLRIGGYSSKPYAASEFVHPFLLHEIGQTHGFPWPSPALMRTKMLDGYEEAHLVGTRAAASKMAVLKKTGDGNGYTGPSADGGGKYMDAEPGNIEELPQGLELQPLDWNYPNGGYGEFVKDILRGIASGLGVSYNTLANDLEGVNFSSGRLGLMEERELWKLLQTWFSTNFCTPIFAKWLEISLTSGAIALELPSGERKPLPRAKLQKFNQPTWHGRRWQWVDPTKEVAAKEQEMANYITSPTRVLAELGSDEDEIIEESKQFLAKIEAAGLPLPRWAVPEKAETNELEPESDDTKTEPQKKNGGKSV